MLGSLFRALPNGVAQKVTALYFKARCIGRGFHSQQSVVDMDKMKVRILPALKDNYMYLIIDSQTSQAAVVDPVEPESVLAAVQEEGATLTKVLVTHHHWDHAGGNKNLIKSMPNLEVFGADERIDCLTHKIRDKDTLCIGSLNVHCLYTPCHTSGHVCYYVTSGTNGTRDDAVFTGDTLFIGGCGRFFEGTATQMCHAVTLLADLPDETRVFCDTLFIGGCGRFFEGTATQMCHAVTLLADLPDETKVFCGHEYTEQNLRFAKKVDKTNRSLDEAIVWARGLRERNMPTVPSTIGKEKLINPFMRVDDICIQQYAGHAGNKVETMAEIRRQKDNF